MGSNYSSHVCFSDGLGENCKKKTLDVIDKCCEKDAKNVNDLLEEFSIINKKDGCATAKNISKIFNPSLFVKDYKIIPYKTPEIERGIKKLINKKESASKTRALSSKTRALRIGGFLIREIRGPMSLYVFDSLNEKKSFDTRNIFIFGDIHQSNESVDIDPDTVTHDGVLHIKSFFYIVLKYIKNCDIFVEDMDWMTEMKEYNKKKYTENTPLLQSSLLASKETGKGRIHFGDARGYSEIKFLTLICPFIDEKKLREVAILFMRSDNFVDDFIDCIKNTQSSRLAISLTKLKFDGVSKIGKNTMHKIRKQIYYLDKKIQQIYFNYFEQRLDNFVEMFNTAGDDINSFTTIFMDMYTIGRMLKYMYIHKSKNIFLYCGFSHTFRIVDFFSILLSPQKYIFAKSVDRTIKTDDLDIDLLD